MESGSHSRFGKILPLLSVAAVMVMIVGALWATQNASHDLKNTVSAEVTRSERLEARPTATPQPTPTPAIITPAGTQSAPELQGIVQWLNSEPLTMEAQEGKVVLIDFWTYS